MTVAEALRRFRKKFGLTQTDVANTLNITLPAYKYERAGLNNGKDILPNSSTLIKLARAYNVSTDYLLGLTDNPTPRWSVDSAENDAVADAASEPAQKKPLTIEERLDRIERALTAAKIKI